MSSTSSPAAPAPAAGGRPPPASDPWRPVKTLCAGGLAGSISRTVVSPLERLKLEFQTQNVVYAERPELKLPTKVIPGLRAMYLRDGFWALFRGNVCEFIQ